MHIHSRGKWNALTGNEIDEDTYYNDSSDKTVMSVFDTTRVNQTKVRT